jgi:hypothetical protein
MNKNTVLEYDTFGDAPSVMQIMMAAMSGQAVGDVPYSLSDMQTMQWLFSMRWASTRPM